MIRLDSSKRWTFYVVVGATIFTAGLLFGGIAASVLSRTSPSLEAQLSGMAHETPLLEFSGNLPLSRVDFGKRFGDSRVGFADAVSVGRSGSENPNRLLRRYIEDADNDQLRRIARGALKFPPEFMDNITDVKSFASRLTDIVLMDTDVSSMHAFQDAPNITFSDSNDFDYPSDVASSQFSQDADKIYAIFSRGSFPGSDVFAKWYHVDTGTYVAIRHHFVDPHSQYNWIWQGGQERWVPGLYQVELYAGQDDLPIIATGEYYVN